MEYDPMTGAPANNVEPPKQEKNTIAIVALILSILGFNIISLILGIMGLKKSRELNEGKGISVIAIVLSILQIVALVLILACGFFFTAMIWPEVKEEMTQTAYCTMAYDCELVTKSEYSCKYRDADNKEQTISCPWTDVNTNQQKVTTTTVKKLKNAQEAYDITNYIMSYKKISPEKATIKEGYEEHKNYSYKINNKEHIVDVYSYNTITPECLAENSEDYCNNNYEVLTIDNNKYNIKYSAYSDEEVLSNLYDGPEGSVNTTLNNSDIIKDSVTGEEYYLLVLNQHAGGGFAYYFFLLDKDDNVLFYYRNSGSAYTKADQKSYLKNESIEFTNNKARFLVPTDDNEGAVEIFIGMENGKVVASVGDILNNITFAGME